MNTIWLVKYNDGFKYMDGFKYSILSHVVDKP